MSDMDDMIRDDRLLDTPNRRCDEHRFYSSSTYDMYHAHHRYHPYKRNDRGYSPNEFKKANPHTFDGDVKKPKDAEAWLLWMNKLF